MNAQFIAVSLFATACVARPPIVIPEGRGAVRFEITGQGDMLAKAIPLRNASVMLTLADRSRTVGEVRTDSTGIVTFNDLVPAKYTVRLRVLGFTPKNRDITVRSGKFRVEPVRLVSSVSCPPLARGETVRNCM